MKTCYISYVLYTTFNLCLPSSFLYICEFNLILFWFISLCKGNIENLLFKKMYSIRVSASSSPFPVKNVNFCRNPFLSCYSPFLCRLFYPQHFTPSWACDCIFCNLIFREQFGIFSCQGLTLVSTCFSWQNWKFWKYKYCNKDITSVRG